MKNGRVRLLFRDGMSCYRQRRSGCRKKKSVRGCIIGHDIAILSCTLEQQGENPVEGLTDQEVGSKRLGPKRATKIRQMFGLTKEDDVRKFVVRRVVKEGNKNT